MPTTRMLSWLSLSSVSLTLLVWSHLGQASDDSLHHGEAIVEWVRENDGHFSSKLEIRKLSETSHAYGVFAIEDISDTELLFEIPRECVLVPRQGHVGDRVSSIINDVEYDGTIVATYTDDDGDMEYDILFDDGDESNRVTMDEFDFELLALQCATVRQLADEMRLGQQSDYAPFVDYLKSQPSGDLPTTWSSAGQELLMELLGGDSIYDIENQELPPYETFGWIESDWHGICNGSDDPLEEEAAAFVIQRGWDEMLIPIFDMLSHRNGRWHNIEEEPVRGGASVRVMASRDIKAGEEIYNSYNFCVDCEGRYHNYGTAEILRDYGFVEPFPQRWIFPKPHNIEFDLDEEYDEDDKPTGKIKLTWINDRKEPSKTSIKWFKSQYKRVKEFGDNLGDRPKDVPVNEWDVIVEYQHSLERAMMIALEALESSSSGFPDDQCLYEKNVKCSKDRYSALEIPEKEEWGDERPELCDYHLFYVLNEWDEHQKINSHYQEITFSESQHIPGDMCFDLDWTFQICESYRPHYHEMMVHYPARFLPEIKRVMFVGGGDSMLLHEVLKYPSLEKVVGLELDQQVTRGTFRHFGVQPHFDEEKVEWWFGDATKSLLMLPKDYFNSFDLVLVDLSETAMALTVTGDMDVIEALTLLLKPEGILVKNEYWYYMEMIETFQYALHVHFYDVPMVCTQSLIMGSRTIDFLNAELYDHDVPTLYSRVQDHYVDIIHDYTRNSSIVQKSFHPNLETQESSPGILMIIEAEDATEKLIKDDATLRKTVEKAIKKSGLSLRSSSVLTPSEDSVSVLFFLEEGYILAQAWPKNRYCAFDVHLWGSFVKQNEVKKALIEGVGSKVDGPSSSSYRVVAGGNFGLGNWKEDAAARGPGAAEDTSGEAPGKRGGKKDEGGDEPASNTRIEMETQVDGSVGVGVENSRKVGDVITSWVSGNKPDSPRKLGPVNQTSLSIAFEAGLELISEPEATVAVLCGEKSQKCDAVELLQAKEGRVGEMHTIWACSGVEGGFEKQTECEKTVLDSLKSFYESSKKQFDAIIVDPSAPYQMGQVAHRIFAQSSHVDKYVKVDDIVVLAMLPGDEEEWRREFVDDLRKTVIVDEPVFRSDVRLSDARSTFGMSVTASGDELFVHRLLETVSAIEKTAEVEAVVENIRGGEFRYLNNFVPTEIFTHRDYDMSDSKLQWTQQTPLGYQTVFQFEGGVDGCEQVTANTDEVFRASDTKAKVESHPEISGDGCIVLAHWQGGRAIVLWDGRTHVDINLMTYEQRVTFADEVAEKFKKRFSKMQMTLRDVQPRGTGRVINFVSDLNDRVPLWTTAF